MARRTREVWENLISEYKRSGKSQKEFAAERQISVGTLRSWIYRREREEREEPTAILPVRMTTPSMPVAQRCEDLEKGTAPEVIVVGFGSGASSEWIGEVVNRLRRC
jgi:hypothetical protein